MPAALLFVAVAGYGMAGRAGLLAGELMVTSTTDLHPWRCANESCPSRRSDAKGQIVMKGENVPGWRGEGYCHQCRHYTYVEVTLEGYPQYLLRPSPPKGEGLRPAASRGLALVY